MAYLGRDPVLGRKHYQPAVCVDLGRRPSGCYGRWSSAAEPGALHQAGATFGEMEGLGHSQISMTPDIYTHVMPAQQLEVADALDQRLTGDADWQPVRTPGADVRLLNIPFSWLGDG